MAARSTPTIFNRILSAAIAGGLLLAGSALAAKEAAKDAFSSPSPSDSTIPLVKTPDAKETAPSSAAKVGRNVKHAFSSPSPSDSSIPLVKAPDANETAPSSAAKVGRNVKHAFSSPSPSDSSIPLVKAPDANETAPSSAAKVSRNVLKESLIPGVVIIVNLVCWLIFWRFLRHESGQWRERSRQRFYDLRDRLQSLEIRFISFQQGFDDLTREIARLRDSSIHTGHSAHSPQPLKEGTSEPTTHTTPSPEFAPVRVDFLAPSQVFEPISRPAVVQHNRESLGETFVNEIRGCAGEEVPIVWERFLAKVKQAVPDVQCSQLHWDRAANDVRFRDTLPGTYRDTGTCWRLTTGGESMLFFRALISQARKRDLPGCQVASSDSALLDSKKLLQFVPPLVVADGDGWRIQNEGVVTYS